MRKRIRFLFLPLLIALAGCEPEDLPTAFAVESTGQEVVSFTFSVIGYDDTSTKACAADIEDDEVDRLDIFIYDSQGWIYGHKVFGEYGGDPLDLSEISFRDSGPNGVFRYYLIMANLDPDSAQYIGYLDKIDLARYPEGFIPWSAGNCRPNRPLMGATAVVQFNSTTSKNVSLMRYMSKFKIGTITAEFWGSPDLYRNVYVKHIAFVNAWDIIRICQKQPQQFSGDPTDIFGPRGWYSGAFGGAQSSYYKANCFLGQEEWSQHNMTYADMHGTYNLSTYGAKGKLLQDYNYLYNDNYLQPKNTINLTCPASLEAISQHTWDVNAYTNNGKLCDEYTGDLGPLQVNKVFYTLPTKFNAWLTEPVYDANSQNNELRLVLAVKINGTLYFYTYMITGLNPNMYYIIANITLKGEPSEYANVWVRGGVVTKSGNGVCTRDENQWRIHGNVAEIDNLVLSIENIQAVEECL